MIQTTEHTELSVVMPAYNEGLHICRNLLKAGDIISKFCEKYEIIAVNDGSSDNTFEEIKKAANQNSRITYISYSNNQGKGHAIATGIKKAEGEFIAFLDSDLELSPSLLKKYLGIMKEENADIVIGSKQHPQSKLDYPLSRRIMSYGYYVILKILFHMELHDTQTGIKLFKKEVIKPIAGMLTTDGYAFDIEILAIANKKGYVIKEAPIVLNYSRNDSHKSRRISISDIWQIFTDTLHIRKEIKNLT